MKLKFLKVILVILLEKEGGNVQAVLLTDKKNFKQVSREETDFWDYFEGKVLKENPATQRTVAKSIKNSVSSPPNR